jgi:hypothetical protein
MRDSRPQVSMLFVILVVLLTLLNVLVVGAAPRTSIAYSRFLNLVGERRVSNVVISSTNVTGSYQGVARRWTDWPTSCWSAKCSRGKSFGDC